MSKIAKYQIVERAIRDSINSGELSAGDQLMTEEDLCRKYGFSRTTIGKALDNLRTSGYIERIPGKGTFVRASRVEKSTSSGRSFSEDMEAIGMTASAKLISYESTGPMRFPKSPQSSNCTMTISCTISFAFAWATAAPSRLATPTFQAS